MPYFYMVKNNVNDSVSFVYTPKKPSCLRADGTCDYVKLNDLIEQAKAGDEKATMLVFEQYQGLWKKIITEFQSKFEEFFYDYEDLQQEAFLALLIALRKQADKNLAVFGEFYGNIFRNNLIELMRKEKKLVNAQSHMCSLDVRDEEGNLLYDIPDNTETDYFSDYYPKIKALLTDREFKIAILHYVDGVALKEIAKELGISYNRIMKISANIKRKLKILI